MTQKKILIDRQASGFKIDRAILYYQPKISRRAIRRALDSGLVTVNGKVERFASRIVHAGNTVLIKIIEEKRKSAKIDILEPFIVYEDEAIIAINKPPHVLSQKAANKTLLDAKSLLISYCKEKNKKLDFKPILCHRLDKETSGVLVFAKSQESCDWIMSQFKERKCKKTYEAISCGKAVNKSWTQKNHLSPLKEKSQRVEVVNSGGKTAITSFSVLKTNSKKNICLIEAKPLTGRSHQIRVQLSHNNLSILGDKKYQNKGEHKLNALQKSFDHHLLHAKSLKIQSKKKGTIVTITADPPKSFVEALKLL